MKLLHPDVRDVTDEDLPDLYDPDGDTGPGPHLRAGFVSSLDGVVAVDGRSAALGSAADKAVFRALRTVADAVVVGAGTARAEDYGPVRHSAAATAWRAAHGRSESTPVVVVSRSGRLPERLLGSPVLLAVPEGVDVPAGVEVVRAAEPAALVAALHARGLRRLLCEGGPQLLTTLLGAGLVDELCLTTAPALVGDGPHLLGEVPRTGLRLLSLVHADPGVLLGRWGVVRSGDE